MERYDSGLRMIANAQQARDAGKYKEAHEAFVKGIEELMRLLQQETNESTKGLVRKHVSRFMSEAEKMVEAQNLSNNVVPQRVKMLQATAQGVEKRARDAERSLKFAQAMTSYTEAAEKYKGLRQEAAGHDELRAWAGERALAMLDGAERLKGLLQSRNDAASTAAPENPLNLPHVPGSAAEEQARVPENFAQPEPNLPNKLPNSLTETFVRGKTKKDPAEDHVLILGNKINGRIYERMHACDGDWHNFDGAECEFPPSSSSSISSSSSSRSSSRSRSKSRSSSSNSTDAAATTVTDGKIYECMHACDGDWHNFDGADCACPHKSGSVGSKSSSNNGSNSCTSTSTNGRIYECMHACDVTGTISMAPRGCECASPHHQYQH